MFFCKFKKVDCVKMQELTKRITRTPALLEQVVMSVETVLDAIRADCIFQIFVTRIYIFVSNFDKIFCRVVIFCKHLLFFQNKK